MTIIEEIQQLKEKHNAIILAHYYTNPEVQDIADYVGDSLELSQMAGKTDADTILFCGVKFMAETAAIISPEKTILIPDISAGCSLADSIEAKDIVEWRKANPDGVVVSYVNTTAEVKGETDICCTSANAVAIINSVPTDTPLLFTPDWNLGNYLAKSSNRNMDILANSRDGKVEKSTNQSDHKMDIWRGNCHVHHAFTTDKVLAKAEQHPEAELLIHPESACSHDQEILDHPKAHILSTSGMLRRAKESSANSFIVVTEAGILHKLKQLNPTKEFIPISEEAICDDMKKVTLEKVVESLRTLQPEVKVSPELRAKAYPSIERMLNRK